MSVPPSVDLNLMRVFRAICEEGNLTAVADKLGLTQPAISYSLSRLRELLNDPLFIRTRQGMVPTPAAQRLADSISIALDILDEAVQSHRAFAPDDSQRVFRLTMSDIGEMTFLPPLCEYLAQHAPGVRLQVDPVSLEDLPDALRQGQIDLAIGNFTSMNRITQHVTLFHEPYACMMRAQHPLARRSSLSRKAYLSQPHLAVSPASNAHRLLEETLLAQGIQRYVALQLPMFLSAPQILRRTDMICTIPRRIARQFNRHEEFKIFPLPVAVPPTDVAVHWHARYDQDAGNRWLRECVIKLLKENA